MVKRQFIFSPKNFVIMFLVLFFIETLTSAITSNIIIQALAAGAAIAVTMWFLKPRKGKKLKK